jgi:HlyD family secretion protein
MATNNTNKNGIDRRKLFKVVGPVVIIVAIGLIVVWLKAVRGGETPVGEMATFVAKRGPLTISVPETGTIKARQQETIKNEMEGRTSIIYLIPEGTHVKKDELLVKLDASTLQDLKIDQEIKVMNAEAAYINAKETLDIVKNQSQSDIDAATLTLDFAQLDLQKYTDPNGQYRNELVTAQNAITISNEEKTRADETLKWSDQLFKEKYISQTELQADQLAVTRSNVKLEVSRNDIELLENFTHKRQLALLDSNVKQAQMALERAQAKARANIVQAEATLKATEQEYERQKGKLAKIIDQLTKAERRAPVDGMVIYATSVRGGGFGRENRQPLDEGVEVFERQDLIYLPTTASAMAEVDVHESHLEKVRLGLPVIITVDALQGKRFVGTVGRIAPLPNPQSMWMNPDLKVYTTEIYLEGDDPSLRSGMSCKADIIVEQYQDVVYIPVHTVLRVGGKHTVYVVKDGKLEERTVEIGLDNNRMVKITSGLNEGEVVSQTPPLKASTVEAISQTPGGASSDANDTTMERINEKLKAANGTRTSPPSDNVAGQPQQGQDRQMGTGSDEAGQKRTAGEGPQGLSTEQIEQMKRRFENMSPEERQKEMEKMKERFQNMSPEEREKMRQQRSQSGGRGQGGGPRPQQSERNQ